MKALIIMENRLEYCHLPCWGAKWRLKSQWPKFMLFVFLWVKPQSCKTATRSVLIGEAKRTESQRAVALRTWHIMIMWWRIITKCEIYIAKHRSKLFLSENEVVRKTANASQPALGFERCLHWNWLLRHWTGLQFSQIRVDQWNGVSLYCLYWSQILKLPAEIIDLYLW